MYEYDTNVLDEVGYRLVNNHGDYRDLPSTDLVFGVELELEVEDHAMSSDIEGGCNCFDCTNAREEQGIPEPEPPEGTVEDYAHDFACATNFHKYGIVKYDGSLDNGLELVTIPGTLEAHKTHMGWRHHLDWLRPECLGSQARTTGMHIHVNKSALSPLCLGKMLVFVNAPANQEFISAIAQRNVTESSRWCKQKPKTLSDGSKLSDDRYQAINVSAETAEFRIFNSTLRYDRLMKNIEFCHALVRFCRRRRSDNVTVHNFIKFVKSEGQKYENLYNFMEEKSLCA